MSTLAIVLIVVLLVVVAFLSGGIAASRRRSQKFASDYAAHLADADHALEAARAADRGWDRDLLESVARDALQGEMPDRSFERLDLVFVDDRPGVAEDRAHFEAEDVAGHVKVVLVRGDQGWAAERIA